MDKKKTLKDVASIIVDDVDALDEEEILHLILETHQAKTFKDTKPTFGEKVSDKMAEVAGSWGFILTFCFILFAWIMINVKFLISPFDPYPFILLNLGLSCLAAIQAPIIMMSQNRQADKDRQRAENDYKVNLKSEIILHDLHDKLDILIKNQSTIIKYIEQNVNKNKK